MDALRHGTWPARPWYLSSASRAKCHTCARPSAQTLGLKLPSSSLFVYIAASAWFALAVTLGLHLSSEVQLGLIVATLVLVLAAVTALYAIARKWRSPGSYLPLVCCLLAVFASPYTVRALEPVLFQHRIAALQALIARSDVASLHPGSSAELNLSVAEQQVSYSVRAERALDGTLLVSIATEGGFPVKHAGYVYSSSGSVDPHATVLRNWSVMRPVTKQWFRAHD